MIVIIDLDGTIIGDITPQLAMYELSKKSNNTIKYTKKNVITSLNLGIIRPYFKSFVTKLSNEYRDIQFYIYTASEEKWAKYIIDCLETSISFKFNRPIFTRKDCIIDNNNNLKKDVEKIFPKILKNNDNFTIDFLRNNYVIIENTLEVYDDQRKIILLPTYKTTIPENIPLFLNHKTFISNKLNMRRIFAKMYNLNIKVFYDFFEFQKFFYKFYLIQLNKVDKSSDDYYFKLYKKFKEVLDGRQKFNYLTSSFF